MRGRSVRMPHNNRVSSSAALQTNDIWSKTIGYDPYRETSDTLPIKSSIGDEQTEGLMLLARLNNVKNGAENRGGCLRCGQLGHFTFQCRNAPMNQGAVSDSSDSDSSSSSESEEDDSDANASKNKKLISNENKKNKKSSNSKEKEHKEHSKRSKDRNRKPSKSHKSHKHKSKHSSRDRRDKHDRDDRSKEKKYSKKSSSYKD